MSTAVRSVEEGQHTGAECQRLRKEHGLAVTELAALTGLQPSTIHRLESGESVTRSTKRLVLVALRSPDEFREAIA